MNIVLIGSGNVATQLGLFFQQAGHQISQVYSRNLANAHALASLLNTDVVDQLAALPLHADIYLIAVSDDAIEDTVAAMPKVEGLVCHCSGASPLTLLANFEKHGVIYPPQSISKDQKASLSNLPFALEGNTASVTAALLAFMQPMAAASFECSTAQRLALHVAAVFVNNFSNALYQISFELLSKHQLPFDLLKPIILETAIKVQHNEPATVQTGPAKRKDEKTIQTHLNFLRQNQRWVEIYQKLTEEITNKNKY